MNPDPTSECTVSNLLADLFAAPFANLDELIAALRKPGVVAALADEDVSLPRSWQFGGVPASYGDATIEVLAWDEGRVVSILRSGGGTRLHVANRYGDLHDYGTGAFLRPATAAEQAASLEAAEVDGGAGVIEIDGRSVYVCC